MRIELEPTKYQSFEDITDPKNVGPRISSLREQLAQHQLDAFLIPLADVHRGESLPDSEQRLAYITGFTGSAGLAIVGKTKAALFVDGRYTIQGPAQTDTNIIDVLPSTEVKVTDWIKENLPTNAKIGFDASTNTTREIKNWESEIGTHASFEPSENLINKIWANRPSPPMQPIELLGENRAGVSRQEKILNLQHDLLKSNADALILNVPESINWLFNIRGRDVPNTPVVLCFAIIPKSGNPTLFVEQTKLEPTQIEQLSQSLNIVDPAVFYDHVARLGADQKTVWVDPASCPFEVTRQLAISNTKLVEKPDPVLHAKAVKNDAELIGMKEAHRLDGIALAKFLNWFDLHSQSNVLSEIDIATSLEAFRRQEKTLVDISFDTISGAGANGAIVHYRVTKSSDRKLIPGELMLVDSGGQYLSGTTDITRTLFSGSATTEQKDRNTRVLKGMIAITTLQFRPKTTGSHLDILARQFLWQKGLNYNHGTGHGVGAFLSVHEGPASISPINHVPLKKGMILSNEPGYYLEGEYGIRIENLLHIVDSKITDGWLAFETLTLAPIEKRLIELELLTNQERDWLNSYHSRVLKEIGPSLEGEQFKWLEQATSKL